jgi:hypothetical protein
MTIKERSEAFFKTDSNDDQETLHDIQCKQIGYRIGARHYIDMACNWLSEVNIHKYQSRELIAQLLKEYLEGEGTIYDYIR